MQGPTPTPLVGYGLVVGLNKTGDRRQTIFSTQSLANMLQQLGVARPPAPDPQGIRDIVRRLVAAENPFVVVSGSGRNPATVPALVRLCEMLGLPVVNSISRAFLSFPFAPAKRDLARVRRQMDGEDVRAGL